MTESDAQRDSLLFSKMKNELPFPYMVYRQIDRVLEDLSNGKPFEAWFSASALKALMLPKIREHSDYFKFSEDIKKKIEKEVAKASPGDEEDKARYNYMRSLIMLEEVMGIIDKCRMLPEQGILGEEGIEEDESGPVEEGVQDTVQ